MKQTTLVISIALLLAGSNASGAATPQVLALEDTATSIGTITSIGFPVATSPDLVIFQATVDPGVGPSFSAIVRHRSGVLSILARSGQVLPGGVQDIDTLFNAGSTVPSQNSAGDAIFGANVGPVGSANFATGLIRFNAATGALETPMRDGDTVPDGFGQMFVSLLNRPVINTSGQIGFYAEISGATGGLGNGDGLFREDQQGVVTIARTAQALPGGGTIDNVSWPTMNDSGQMAFYATSTAGSSAAGMFRGDGNSITKIARKGDVPIPGWVIRSFDPVGGVPINRSGWVAFRAQIDGTGPFDTVFKGNGSALTRIAYAGQAVPGSTGTLRSVDRNVDFNDQGQAAFIAEINDNVFQSGIFRGDGTVLTTIARQGDLVPGTAAGFFTEFRNYPFAINRHGDVAFIARFQLGCCLQNGLFYYSDSGGLERVVTENETLAGSTVSGFAFVGTSSDGVRPGANGLDDAGRIAFRFTLANGLRGVALYGGDRLFRDGFELGDTSGWSLTSP